jgi:hypothetical protein
MRFPNNDFDTTAEMFKLFPEASRCKKKTEKKVI